MNPAVPAVIANVVGEGEKGARDGRVLEKRSPHDGELLWTLARSTAADVDDAVTAAERAQPDWASLTPVARGEVLSRICAALEARDAEFAEVVARETGKSPGDALGEVRAAIACGRFFAGEGQRLFGRTIASGIPDRYVMTVRRPVGVAGLVIAANTPAANVAWKVFPALICGNAAVLKAPEDTPATAWLFARLALEAGLPAGVLNVVQGLGREAGAPLVAHNRVGVVSFTGSTEVGREIARVAGDRLARVSLELGGKNPFVVADDADLDAAVRWAALSAFSNAGQRCASGSRLIVFDAVYDEFKDRLAKHTANLRLGPTDGDDLGPLINERALSKALDAVAAALSDGAVLVSGGRRSDAPEHRRGWYLEPTVVENVEPDAPLSRAEVFAPVTVLYRARGFADALRLADASPYGLTAAIHTRNASRAIEFCMKVRSGIAVVNAGTHGSEPHLPFGGLGFSGNGTREPGTEALDVYSDLKNVYLNVQRDDLA